MLKIDLHIHTIASGHAHNTILEYVNQAKKLKMKVIGISDHGPGPKDSILSEVYFKTIGRIPKTINGIRVLKGVEADIVNSSGKLDIANNIVERLDYVMANFHLGCGYLSKGRKKNTETLIKTIYSGKINVVTHSFYTQDFDVDIKKISEAACRCNVLLEIDLTYLKKNKFHNFTLQNLRIMVDVFKKNNRKLIVGSDAHNIWELADDSILKKYKKEIGLTDEMIINNYPQELFKILKIK